MLTLSNGRPGLRSTLHIDIRPPAADEHCRKDELPRVADPRSETSQPSTVNSQPILDFIASDESLDRCDEVISASGWRLDSYRRNPVFQNAHQYGDILFTLGKALVTEVRTTAHSAVPTQHLYQRIQFATDINPVARIAYGLYKGKFLNAVSVGFIPLRWLDADGQEHTVRGTVFPREIPHSLLRTPHSAEAPHSALRSPHFRRRYLEQELLEVSAVGIPANPNALSLALKSDAVTKSDLVDTLDLLRSLTVDYGPLRPPEALRLTVGSSGVSLANLQPSTCYQQLLHFARELHRILRRA